MELAYLVGDHEEVHLESLKWKEVWVKVACKDPRKINGTSNVYINKQDKGQEDDELTKISWFVANKGHVKPPYVGTDKGQEDDELTDQVDPESQDSFGKLDSNWLKSGTPPQ